MSDTWIELNGKRAEVWKHFLVKANNASEVKCKYCESKFSLFKGTSTSQLIYHIEKVEKISIKKQTERKTEDTTKQTTIDFSVKKCLCKASFGTKKCNMLKKRNLEK